MVELTIPDEIKETLKEVRDDKADTNFVVVGFDDTKPKDLMVFGSGSNGVEGIKALLKPNDVAYCLLRVDYVFEAVGNIKSNTTRFLFLYFRPESVPLKRRMVLGSVEGKVKKAFSPYIRTVEIDSIDKFTDDYMSDLIDSVTMSKDKTTSKKAPDGFYRAGSFVLNKNSKTETKLAKMIPDSRASFTSIKGAAVTFADEAQLTAEINSVRSDSDPKNWCVFSYASKKSIEFTASGNGDFDELLENCPDDKISYGLFKYVENYSSGRNDKGEKTVKIDQVKFGFITFVPLDGGISPIMKAVVATHKGTVVGKFRPFHHQFYFERKSELSAAKVADTFSGISGVKSNITDKKVEKKEEKYERKFLGGATAATQKLSFENKDAFDDAIKDVRNDETPTVFAVAAFVGDKKSLQLKFTATGNSIDSLVESLVEDAVQYVLVRVTEVVDGYNTTKFSLLRYEGADLSSTIRGAAGVFHGAVTDSFGQSHSFAVFTNKKELGAKFSV